MSIWTRISEALSALASGEGLSAVFDRLRTPPERSVAFTIAVIALSAKMAKADGLVTRDEVTAFREVFQIAQADEANAAKVFNLARQDVAGFEEYATRIRGMFGAETGALYDLDRRAVSTSPWPTGSITRTRICFLNAWPRFSRYPRSGIHRNPQPVRARCQT